MIHSTYLINLRHRVSDELSYVPSQAYIKSKKDVDDMLTFRHSAETAGKYRYLRILYILYLTYLTDTLDDMLVFRHSAQTAGKETRYLCLTYTKGGVVNSVLYIFHQEIIS